MVREQMDASAGHLEPISGLRAIACLGILIGHCMFWVVGSASDKIAVYAQLDQHPRMTGLMKMPEPLLETFLVLTGFLAAQSLVSTMPLASSYSSCIIRSATILATSISHRL